ncbi:hypothetical protein DE146DRAFT_177302 [Phaeosphaeria sp. MPI-PUGE-AT-0046c]|nr:hypothetical protein DE146DRAFT_177302 [Phaeosphaeria sp. MPI-PUGE-AT-0046c]
MPSKTLRSLPKTGKPSRVNKRFHNNPTKSSRPLRSSSKYFWYTSRKGLSQLALALDRRPVLQTNAYTFSPAIFARDQPSFALPAGSSWPPRSASDLLHSTDPEEDECIGNTCFNNVTCDDPLCRHSLKHWQISTAHWQDHFDLRETEDRGLGIYMKSSFKRGDVLGWYAGELIPSDADTETDYVMQMPVSAPLSSPLSPYLSDVSSYSEGENLQLRTPPRTRSQSPATEVAGRVNVWIDGARRGNWTRFINHSCRPYAGFQLCRVGHIRVMAVVALRNVSVGVELTVDYGQDYYGRDTSRICYCGASRCVGKWRHGK